MTSALAALPPWAVGWSNATPVLIGWSLLTPAVIVTAPSASRRLAIAGWPRRPSNCCPYPAPRWCSPFPRPWLTWVCKINAASMLSCFAPLPRPCSPSLPIRNIWRRASAFLPCFTRGVRTCCTSRMCIAPARVVSCLFRKKLLAFLKLAFAQGKLQLSGQLAALADPAKFQSWLDQHGKPQWVVYAKPPLDGRP